MTDAPLARVGCVPAGAYAKRGMHPASIHTGHRRTGLDTSGWIYCVNRWVDLQHKPSVAAATTAAVATRASAV